MLEALTGAKWKILGVATSALFIVSATGLVGELFVIKSKNSQIASLSEHLKACEQVGVAEVVNVTNCRAALNDQNAAVESLSNESKALKQQVDKAYEQAHKSLAEQEKSSAVLLSKPLSGTTCQQVEDVDTLVKGYLLR